MQYLKDMHKVQKLGWWRSRDVKPIGLGTDPPPDNETGLPPARVELIVFARAPRRLGGGSVCPTRRSA